jgi:hypothetical protein
MPMTVTLDQIKQHLDELGMRHMVPESKELARLQCAARFATQSYADSDGDHSLLVIFAISEDGEYLEVFSPMAMDASNCKHKGALFAAMLQVAFMTKHVQLEYDADDGEIRFAVDIPVCDGVVTPMQLSCIVHMLVGVMEEYYPVFKHAMETGKVDFSKRWEPESDADEEAGSDDAGDTAKLEALIESMGGIDKLEEALRAMRARGGQQ